VSSPRGFRRTVFERISILHQEECIKAKFLMLPLGGLHVKYAGQRGIWEPTQHLLWSQGKPRKTLTKLAGYRNFRMQTDFCSPAMNKRGLTLILIYAVFFFLFSYFFPSFFCENICKIFFKHTCVYMIWTRTKPCITPVKGMNAYMHKYAYKYTYIYLKFFDCQ
jgi:hypothetical protein